MPWEYIGDCGSGDFASERDRVLAELRLGVQFIKLICGPAPDGCEVGVFFQDHELGAYPSIGLRWDGEDFPDDYYERAERALNRLDDLDWEPLPEDEDADEDEEDEDDQADEPDSGVERSS